MSHIVEAKTSVKNPDQELLSRAATLVARQHGGTIQTYYEDYYGEQHAVPLAIRTPQMRRGIGIKTDETTGELTFVGDNFYVEALYQQIQQETLQMYVALATMQALQAMGYSAQAVEGEAGTRQVVVQGVSYA